MRDKVEMKIGERKKMSKTKDRQRTKKWEDEKK
jgi:hypothetical protein